MTDGIEIAGIGDRALWEALADPDAPSQAWAYAAALAEEGIVPQLVRLRAGGGAVTFAFHVRERDGVADVATLPGLSGAVIRGAPGAALALWRAHARAERWVAGYVQLGPGNGEHPLAAEVAPDRVGAHNVYHVFDLARWSRQDSIGHNLRKSLNRIDRQGVELVTGPEVAAAFPGLLAQAHGRFGSPPPFGPACLEAWARGGARHFGARLEGEIVIAGLCHQAGQAIEGHLVGASEAGRPLHAWLFCAIAEACAAEGLGRFNIGGYGVAGDGLHQMKARLGAVEVPMRSLRQVHDPDRFAAICAAAGVDPGDERYFPPWRRPVA
jgi:hypothetical protein